VKVAVIIDAPNVRGMTKAMGKNINFKAFLKHIRGPNRQLELLEVFYDVVPFNGTNNDFIRSLEDFGFEGIPVPLKPYAPHEKNKATFKSRTDQRITIEVLDHLQHNRFDCLVFVSGDSDYEFLLQKCRDAKKRVEVWATSSTLSNELKKVADAYYNFDDPAFKHLLLKVDNNLPWWKKQRAVEG